MSEIAILRQLAAATLGGSWQTANKMQGFLIVATEINPRDFTQTITFWLIVPSGVRADLQQGHTPIHHLYDAADLTHTRVDLFPMDRYQRERSAGRQQ